MMTPEQVQELQSVINWYRERGTEINVSQHLYDEEEYNETVISIKFSDEYDAMDVGSELRKTIGPCDSGAGFGWRDLQLCHHYPELK